MKSLSEILPINSTLQADLCHPIFELNVTLSFVKIRLGHLPCGSSIASLAGLPTKHQFPLSQNSFESHKSHTKRLVYYLLFSLLCSLKANKK